MSGALPRPTRSRNSAREISAASGPMCGEVGLDHGRGRAAACRAARAGRRRRSRSRSGPSGAAPARSSTTIRPAIPRCRPSSGPPSSVSTHRNLPRRCARQPRPDERGGDLARRVRPADVGVAVVDGRRSRGRARARSARRARSASGSSGIAPRPLRGRATAVGWAETAARHRRPAVVELRPSPRPPARRRCTAGRARTRRGSPRRSPASPSAAAKMSTGQTSVSLAASAGSAATAGVDLDGDEEALCRQPPAALAHPAARTRSGMSSIRSATVIPRLGRRAIFSVAVSSLPSTIVPAWPKRHARHLVHEAAGHEGDDRQLRAVLGHPARQLGLHAAARLGVDDDRPRLLVGLEQRHQLGVGRADDRVAADRDGGRLAEPGGASASRTSRSSCRPSARSRRPGRACRPARRCCAGPPMPPILITSGTMIPRQFGPMMRAPCSVGELDHLRRRRGAGSAR